MSKSLIFLALDYSQIEMRIEAHISKDPAMLNIFNTGGDLHTFAASRMFHKPEAEIDPKKERYPAKRTGFGILYGIGGLGLVNVFHNEGVHNFTEQDCDKFIEDWFNTFPKVRDSMEEVHCEAIRHGFVRDLFGRLRYIPEVYSTIGAIKAAGLRQAGNVPNQSGGQGIIKEAMVQLTPWYKRFEEWGVYCKPILQIHDELVFEVDERFVGDIVNVFKPIMEGVVKLDVPILVDAEVGYNLADLKTYKEVTDGR